MKSLFFTLSLILIALSLKAQYKKPEYEGSASFLSSNSDSIGTSMKASLMKIASTSNLATYAPGALALAAKTKTKMVVDGVTSDLKFKKEDTIRILIHKNVGTLNPHDYIHLYTFEVNKRKKRREYLTGTMAIVGGISNDDAVKSEVDYNISKIEDGLWLVSIAGLNSGEYGLVGIKSSSNGQMAYDFSIEE